MSILRRHVLQNIAIVLVVTTVWPLVAAADSGSASNTAAPMTPRDVSRLRSVLSAAVSPDGRRVAYTLAVPRDPFAGSNGPAYVELHVLDAEGKTRPFITGKVNISSIAWTPDGSGIAYTAKRGEDKYASLYVVPVDGGESRRLIAHDASIHHARFRPDGKVVAFLATPPRSKSEQEWRDKGFNQEIYEEDWRPTKVWLAEVKVGAGKPRALELPGSAFDLAWSPDGRYLAVALAPRPLVDDSYMFKRIAIVDVTSGSIVERVKNPGKLGRFAFSPDGKHLAMISAADINDPAEGRLMVAAIPGDGSLRDLMPTYEAHVESFAWIDDKTIAFVGAEGTETRVARVTLDGKTTDWVKPGVAVFQSITVSRGSGSSTNVVAALVGHSPRHPGEVFVLKSPGPLKRQTDSNPWLARRRLARQETVRFRARDGLELEGVLVYPLNHEPGRRYPLILTVHGGPESHVPNGWVTRYAYAGQVGAARGFAVFYPNYRGSTGRGVKFSKLGQADAAGKEFEDLIDAIDHLVKMGLVDRKRVGITGGSYGGYASAWGATFYSEHFAASVMFVGISDNVSKVGTTDIPEEMYLVHHRKRLWDDWEYFLERSPIRHVKKGHTPTLILHGKEDPRVHPSQSMELYRHLKTLGQAPVRLVFYPGEGHGNRKAAARFDYNLRMLRWMEHYLQGSGGPAPPYAIDYSRHRK